MPLTVPLKAPPPRSRPASRGQPGRRMTWRFRFPTTLVPLVSTDQSMTYYTGETLKGGTCAADDVQVFVEPQNITAAPPQTWVPFLDISSAADPARKVRFFGTHKTFRKQRISIPAQDLCGLPRNSNAVGLTLILTPGVVFQRGGPDTVGRKSSKLFLGSIIDFPGVPITVYLTRVGKHGRSPHAWLPQAKVPGRLAAGSYAIQLKTAQDLPALFDLIAANGAFTFDTAPVDGMESIVHLAANGVILASVGGPSYKKKDIRRLASALDANVAFAGQQSDLIARPRAGVNRIGVLESALAKNGKILVMANNRIVTLRRDDAQYDEDQMNVLARTASSAFKPRAEVVIP